LESESLLALRAALPGDRLLFRDEPTDYGVDCSLELVVEGRVTNFRCQVQVKATDSELLNADGTVSLRVDASNLNYMLCGSCPLYVLYVAPRRELRYLWARDERDRLDASTPGWREQGTVTLRFGTLLATPSALDELCHRIRSEGRARLAACSASTDGASSQEATTPTGTRLWGMDDGSREPDPDRLVDAGGRIRQVRRDLGLDLPLFARALGHPDQRALGRIEAGKDQAPLWLVRRVAALSGGRAEWIELGASAYRHNARRYTVGDVSLYEAPEDLKDLLSQRPTHLYLCLEPRSKQVAAVAEFTDLHWRAYDLCRLDFWRWGGSRHQIPKVRAFLQGALDAPEILCSCCFLPAPAMARILSGETHPRRDVRAAVGRARSGDGWGYGKGARGGLFWAEDLVNIYKEGDGVDDGGDSEEDYERRYGRWFVRARQMMREWDGAIHPFEAARLAAATATASGEHIEEEENGERHGGRCVAESEPAWLPLRPPMVTDAAVARPPDAAINLLPRCRRLTFGRWLSI
jgi:hypothetical protein